MRMLQQYSCVVKSKRQNTRVAFSGDCERTFLPRVLGFGCANKHYIRLMATCNKFVEQREKFPSESSTRNFPRRTERLDTTRGEKKERIILVRKFAWLRTDARRKVGRTVRE